MKSPISFHEASHFIKNLSLKRQSSFLSASEIIPIEEAVGRTSFETTFSKEAIPSFDNSSMDGFAVRAEESLKASLKTPLTFEVQGRILAGDAPITNPAGGTRACYEIMTGAPIPLSFDAVYKIEDVEVEYDSSGKPLKFSVTEPIDKHSNFRGIGSDFAVGKKLFDAQTLLMPEQIMALASIGVGEIKVLRKPKIALLSTGSELVDPRDAILLPGKIRNSTKSYLLTALNLLGAEVFSYGNVEDSTRAFESRLSDILKDKPDIIITTGAVSKGCHDFIPAVVKKLGAEILFHNAAIRPGKPQLFAEFPEHGPVFFGIPGNPISTAVGVRFFVEAYLRSLTGKNPEQPMKAVLTESVEKPLGFRCFYKAKLEVSESGMQVTSLGGQASFIVSSFLQANGWLVLPEDLKVVPRGSIVDFIPMYPLAYDYLSGLKNDVIKNSGDCC